MSKQDKWRWSKSPSEPACTIISRNDSGARLKFADNNKTCSSLQISLLKKAPPKNKIPFAGYFRAHTWSFFHASSQTAHCWNRSGFSFWQHLLLLMKEMLNERLHWVKGEPADSGSWNQDPGATAAARPHVIRSFMMLSITPVLFLQWHAKTLLIANKISSTCAFPAKSDDLSDFLQVTNIFRSITAFESVRTSPVPTGFFAFALMDL